MHLGLTELEITQLGALLLIGALLLTGIWLLVLRLRRVEESLRGLPRADEIETRLRAALPDPERLRAVEDGLKRLSDALAALPRPLQPPDLAPLLTQIDACEQQLGDLVRRAQEPNAAAAAPAPADPSSTLVSRLHRILEQRGFESVRVLVDVPEGEPGEELRVPVEARRAGMSYKGLVTLAEGRVTDVALKPATEIFP